MAQIGVHRGIAAAAAVPRAVVVVDAVHGVGSLHLTIIYGVVQRPGIRRMQSTTFIINLHIRRGETFGTSLYESNIFVFVPIPGTVAMVPPQAFFLFFLPSALSIPKNSSRRLGEQRNWLKGGKKGFSVQDARGKAALTQRLRQHRARVE